MSFIKIVNNMWFIKRLQLDLDSVIHEEVTNRSRYSVIHKKVTIRSRYSVIHKKVTIRARHSIVDKKVTIVTFMNDKSHIYI